MANTYLEYYGVADPSVFIPVDRGDGVVGTFTGCVTNPDPQIVNNFTDTYLDYHGVTSVDNVIKNVDRGDGFVGTFDQCVPTPIVGKCTIEKVVHSILSGSRSIQDLVPLERIVTGKLKGNPAFPFVSVNREGGSPDIFTNTGHIDRRIVRFQIWDENHDRGSCVLQEFEDLFTDYCGKLALQDGEKVVLLARAENSFGIEEPDAVWQFLLDVIFWTEER